MMSYIRLMGLDAIMEGNGGKEVVMSGLEKEELADRIKGMTPEEQTTVAGNLPDGILWSELLKRFTERTIQVENVRKDME